jgi:hypothetical protein
MSAPGETNAQSAVGADHANMQGTSQARPDIQYGWHPANVTLPNTGGTAEAVVRYQGTYTRIQTNCSPKRVTIALIAEHVGRHHGYEVAKYSIATSPAKHTYHCGILLDDYPGYYTLGIMITDGSR